MVGCYTNTYIVVIEAIHLNDNDDDKSSLFYKCNRQAYPYISNTVSQKCSLSPIYVNQGMHSGLLKVAYVLIALVHFITTVTLLHGLTVHTKCDWPEA